MIKNDFRYIIKKILIGIGIIFGISFIRSCNVYASGEQYYQLRNVTDSSYNYSTFACYSVGTVRTFKLNNTTYNIQYKNNGLYVNDNLLTQNNSIGGSSNCMSWSILLDESTKYVYVLANRNVNVMFLDSISNTTNSFPIELNRLSVSRNSYLNGAILGFNGNQVILQNNNITTSNTNVNCGGSDWGQHCYTYNKMYLYGSSARVDLRVGFPDGNATANDYYYSSNFNDPVLGEPEIISLNPVLNKTDDNMLVSVSFSPEFSFIDTENYNYYSWFDGEQKLQLTENNVSINTQKNTTFYVEITDKQGNSIDTETYTVSSIGLVYNGDYDIQFKNEEYTESDTENDSDELYDIINRIDIDILYIPKWINYKYEYQWVSYGDSPTDNWTLVNNNNDKNNFVYTTRENGTLYARILDSDNNLLKSSTFTITRIGAIKTYDKNTDKFYGMFNIIKSNLNFGGPISDLIVIPVNIIQSIFNASNKVCIPYNLGSIGGHNITLPCIEPEDYLGSALWTTIDLIFSGCMFFAISKWFTSAYYNFILLDNTPGIKERRDLD